MKPTKKRSLSLKQLLDFRLLSQIEVSQLADITRADVCRYVNRQRAPRMRVVRKLSTALNAKPVLVGKHWRWIPNECEGSGGAQ